MNDIYFHLVAEWAHLLMPVLSDVKFSWNGVTKKTQEIVMKNSKIDKQVPYTEFLGFLLSSQTISGIRLFFKNKFFVFS